MAEVLEAAEQQVVQPDVVFEQDGNARRENVVDDAEDKSVDDEDALRPELRGDDDVALDVGGLHAHHVDGGAQKQQYREETGVHEHPHDHQRVLHEDAHRAVHEVVEAMRQSLR